MRYRTFLRALLALCFLLGLQPLVFSDTAGIDPRDVALDKSLGGMKEGSRILSPHGEIHAGGHRGAPGSHVRSAATHQPAVSAPAPGPSVAIPEANRGIFNNGSSSGTGANIGTESAPLPGGNTGGNFGGSAESGTEGGGSSGSAQEPTGGGSTESSIIEVDADANLETDNPSAGGDVTINPDAGGEQSIIEADVEADLSGGSPTVEAEATIDPNADDGLVDAEATTSSDIVEQELTSSTGLEVDNGANTTAAETTVSSETGGTTAPATNEVTGGVEADVEGAGAGDDVECNEADGLLCPPKL